MTIEREAGPYQLYITYIGGHSDEALRFIADWLDDLQTPAAVLDKITSDIRRAQPSLTGLSRKTADAIADQLHGWQINAAVYHADDEDRPQFDHNRFGVTLVDAGRNKEAVSRVLQDQFGISRQMAGRMVGETPKSLLEHVSINEAIALAERLRAAGALCELPATKEQVWRPKSAADIPRNAGPYHLILQRSGPITGQLLLFLQELRPDLERESVQDLIDNAPTQILTNVALETAELTMLRLNDLAAKAIIQHRTERESLGAALHPHNPSFAVGGFQVLLSDYDRLRRVALISKLRDLIPGIALAEAVALLRQIPVVVVDEVGEASATGIVRQLAEVGAVAVVTANGGK